MLLDLLFPKTCLGCNAFGRYVCQKCREKIEYIQKDACLKCDRIHTNGYTHDDCKEDNGLDGYLSIFYYTEVTKRILKGIKYKFVSDCCKEFFNQIPSKHLSKFLRLKNDSIDCYLQPIPLHPSRQAKRGFNQADIIAQFFSLQTNVPVVDFLKRTKKTQAQAQTVDKVARTQNMKNAFSLRKNAQVQNKTIILVDDVLTTGCTVKEAAKVLKKNGAAYVFAFSLAHG